MGILWFKYHWNSEKSVEENTQNWKKNSAVVLKIQANIKKIKLDGITHL